MVCLVAVSESLGYLGGHAHLYTSRGSMRRMRLLDLNIRHCPLDSSHHHCPSTCARQVASSSRVPYCRWYSVVFSEILNFRLMGCHWKTKVRVPWKTPELKKRNTGARMDGLIGLWRLAAVARLWGKCLQPGTGYLRVVRTDSGSELINIFGTYV